MLWPVLSMNFAPGRLQAVLALHKGLFPAQAWDFTIKKKKKQSVQLRTEALYWCTGEGNRALSLALSAFRKWKSSALSIRFGLHCKKFKKYFGDPTFCFIHPTVPISKKNTTFASLIFDRNPRFSVKKYHQLQDEGIKFQHRLLAFLATVPAQS